jgi:hypothetical protein
MLPGTFFSLYPHAVSTKLAQANACEQVARLHPPLAKFCTMKFQKLDRLVGIVVEKQ